MSPETKAPLTTQENALATAMLYRIGDATVHFTMDEQGTRRHQSPNLSGEDFNKLVSDYSRDPKESLAWARESLFAIGSDERLSDSEKDERLDRYLDAYFDLTLKLDHAAFPATKPGEVEHGVPEYLPDGFVDMGGDSAIEPEFRNREQIWVDKKEVLTKYKPTLKEIFSHDFSKGTLTAKKKSMAIKLAMDIYFGMPYDYEQRGGQKNLGGNKAKLSEMDEGLCRHQGLVFQVLCQAVGLKSQVLKSRMDDVRHSTNMVRFDNEWYIFDVTNPDYKLNGQGQKEWRPGSYKVDGPPEPHAKKVYNVTKKYSDVQHVYEAHDNMFWRIEELQRAA